MNKSKYKMEDKGTVESYDNGNQLHRYSLTRINVKRNGDILKINSTYDLLEGTTTLINHTRSKDVIGNIDDLALSRKEAKRMGLEILSLLPAVSPYTSEEEIRKSLFGDYLKKENGGEGR